MVSNILLKKRVIAVVILLVSVTGILSLMFLHNAKVNANTVKITETDPNKIHLALNKQVEEGKINVQYQLHSIFEGKESKEFLVRNNPNNYHPILFKIYDEKDRIIYESDQLMLGYEVNKIYLDKELSKGEHDCKIEIGYDSKGNVASRFPLKLTVI